MVEHVGSSVGNTTPNPVQAILTLLLIAVWFLGTVVSLWIVIGTGVRRMHDTDHSGWWLLFPFVNLVFALMGPSHDGGNRFGPNPRNIA